MHCVAIGTPWIRTSVSVKESERGKSELITSERERDGGGG